MDTKKMRACAPLLPEPGNEVVCECLDEIEKLRREAEIAGLERNHAKACYERTVRILTGIHALLYPPRFTDNDGRTWQFKSPLAEEQMQELSDRIRALPDEIEAIDSAMKTPNARLSGPQQREEDHE